MPCIGFICDSFAMNSWWKIAPSFCYTSTSLSSSILLARPLIFQRFVLALLGAINLFFCLGARRNQHWGEENGVSLVVLFRTFEWVIFVPTKLWLLSFLGFPGFDAQSIDVLTVDFCFDRSIIDLIKARSVWNCHWACNLLKSLRLRWLAIL